MKKVLFIMLALCLSLPAHAAAFIAPSFDLEKKIAYQQGQFGALYAQCGSHEDQAVIGGSLASWRLEAFQGYKGAAEERASIEKAFDESVQAVVTDPKSCDDWIKQAAATWHGIVRLSLYGLPTAKTENP